MHALYRDFLARENCTITANSQGGARDYARWLDTDVAAMPLLTNAIDMAALDPAVIRKGPRWKAGQRFTLGGVFRLASNKRPLLWLATAAALRHTHGLDFRPVLFGSGPLEQDLRNSASELGLADLEIITDTADPAVIYGDLDAMLLMSRVEGLPNVVLEAQASGVPVAACDVGGVSEALLQRGPGAGLLLDRDISAEGAADQIAPWLALALTGSPGARRAFVARSFAPEAIAASALSLYLGGTG
jgi:glycosyltransferase involved in cell wall biosynthesis